MLAFLEKCWNVFKTGLMASLPLSPFQGFISYLSDIPYLGYINWFIPMDTIVSVTFAWCVAVGTYYVFSVIMRWIKVIR